MVESALYIVTTYTEMKWLTYDLESTFLQKGYKRGDTLILEIALFKGKREAYQSLVNPVGAVTDGKDLIARLDDEGQSPEKTINFWTKLLIGKKMLNTAVKRKSLEEKADKIAELLGDEETFRAPKDVLQEAIAWGEGHTWIAHNGTSFNSKIILGQTKKMDIPIDVHFEDSLPLFKNQYKDCVSYSQPLLYKVLFPGTKYMAHHALEDSKALHKMIAHTIETTGKDIEKLFHVKKMPRYKDIKSDLIDIKGIGKVSVAKFKDKGIHSKKDLKKYVDTSDLTAWMKDFKGVHAYKKLGEKLYSGDLIL